MNSKLVILIALIAAMSSAVEADGVRKKAPVLSGAYAISGSFNCTDTSSHTVSQLTGQMTFNATAGTATIQGYRADGEPMTLTQFSHGPGPYSNTATTVTFNGTTYQANFGALKKGVATYVSLLAVDLDEENELCGDQYWLALE